MLETYLSSIYWVREIPTWSDEKVTTFCNLPRGLEKEIIVRKYSNSN